MPATHAEPANASPPSTLSLTCALGDLTLDAAVGDAGAPVDASGETLPRFRMVAYTGGAMTIDGWRHPVVVDLEGLSIPSQRRPIRFAHSAFQGIGHTERIAVEDGRLVAEGVVSRDTPVAREVVTSGKRGFPWQASIGASVQRHELIRAGKFATVNGRRVEGPTFVARATTLGEISFVDLGADGDTEATIAARRAAASGASLHPHATSPEAAAMPDENRSAAESIHTVNADSPTPATPAVALHAAHPGAHQGALPGALAGAIPGALPGAALPDEADLGVRSKPRANAEAALPDPVQSMRAAAAAEAERLAAIRKLCASAGDTSGLESRAIAEGWDTTRTELELLRASRPRLNAAPNVHAPDRSVNAEVLEAACLLSARIESPETHAAEPALDAAAKRFRGGIGLQELLLEAAWANGYHGRGFRDPRNVLRAAFGAEVAASGGFSMIDVGGILSNVANKFLLEGFFRVERTWRNICAVRNVTDFKTVTSYRLVGQDQYEQVAPGGELKHGALGELAYANKADTYGLMLSIDRRDIINDDLGAITTVPRKLGRGSGLKINDVFWSTFLNHNTFFSTANRNLLAADSALSIDALSAAEVLYLDQTDPDGKPVGGIPQVILVPTALATLATTLYKSLEVRSTAALSDGSGATYPVANPHAGKFRVEVSRYLSNSQYANASAAAWYLLSDPADLPVIEVAFLNGQEAPTIETAEADFHVLGVQMRGYHDFGVALQEHRGGVKAKGTGGG